MFKELVRGMMAIISVTNDVANQQRAQCQVTRTSEICHLCDGVSANV